ncbi:TonB-dependent receptor [Parapedobacter sp. DT-150]|uniref:TonB-dependent receptor n=1 Tax=Parapedobacter sp. DT-150 TaxID=3396162 RepID=UPI003F1BAD53
MRFNIIVGLLLSIFIQVSASTYAQKVSLDVKDIPLGRVFKLVEDQTGYVFVYDDVSFKKQKVSLAVQQGTIEEVLEASLQGLPVSYKIVERNILLKRDESKLKIRVAAIQQPNLITGRVSDSLDNPLQGVSVAVKGAPRGISTDQEGRFQISASQGEVLVFSLMGYQQREVTVSGQGSINVVLKVAVSDLDEVVVVGYGTQRKENLTGAVTQLSGERLQNRFVTNISQALQGQVANLNIHQSGGGAPGAAPTINIRGYTGFGGTAAPLVVIDGIQGGNLNDINMNDVESVSVLKDAASAAIYGSSAPYGVILITTKKGKVGQKPTITYNNNFGFAHAINLPETMSSLDYATFWNEAADNSQAAHWVNDEQLQRIKDYLEGKITDETIVNPAPGTDAWLAGNANHDWYDILLRNASFSHQHTVGMSGNANKTSYYVGLGYVSQGGVWKGLDDHFKRYNARANLSSELTDWLDFNFRGAFTRGNTFNRSTANGGTSIMERLTWLRPWDPVTYPNGTKHAQFTIMSDQGGKVLNEADNAVLTGEFVFHPLPGWDITANYTYDGRYIQASNHTPVINIYNSPSGPTGTPGNIGGSPNSFSRSFSRNQHHTVNAFSSYEKQLENHYVKVMAGFTQELTDVTSMDGSNNYLFSDNVPSLSLSYGPSPSIGDNAWQLAIRAWFGRINYNYKEKYLIEFNGRYDGSSKFLKDSRYNFYPGISAAWLPSKEAFWSGIEPVVNSFKIRASYGSLGDQSVVGTYPFYPSLGVVRSTSNNWLFGGARESSVNAPGLVNPLLTWVTTTTLDFGTDLTFLRNRLNVSFDWYQRYMDDYIGPAESMPAFLGTGVPGTNSTAVETKGFELTVGWQDHINDFHYGVNAVWSDYRGFVRKYPNPSRLNNTWYVGQEMGAIWGYETVGLFQSEEEIAAAPSQNLLHSRWTPGDVQYADLNGDNVIDWGENTIDNPGDRKVIGNTTPRYSFGVNMNAQYKGFDLTVFLQGVGKRDVFPGNRATRFWGIDGVGGPTQSTGLVQHLDRWSADSPDGYYAKNYATDENLKNRQMQTRYLQDASYLRIKNLQLGYSIPVSWNRQIGSQKVRFFVNAENLVTVTNLIKTLDPEFSNTAGLAYMGSVDGNLYPLQRTWAFGLNIAF